MTFVGGIGLLGLAVAGLACAVAGFALGWKAQPLFVSDRERWRETGVQQIGARLSGALVGAAVAAGLAIYGLMEIMPINMRQSVETTLGIAKPVDPFTSESHPPVNTAAIAQQKRLLDDEKAIFLQKQAAIHAPSVTAVENRSSTTNPPNGHTEQHESKTFVEKLPPNKNNTQPPKRIRISNELLFIDKKITEMTAQWKDAQAVLASKKPALGRQWKEGEPNFYTYMAARLACEEVEQAAVVLKSDKARLEQELLSE